MTQMCLLVTGTMTARCSAGVVPWPAMRLAAAFWDKPVATADSKSIPTPAKFTPLRFLELTPHVSVGLDPGPMQDIGPGSRLLVCRAIFWKNRFGLPDCVDAPLEERL